MNKKEILTAIANVEYVPNVSLIEYELDKKKLFSIDDLAKLGPAAEPLLEMMKKVSSLKRGGSGFYYVKTGSLKMFKSKETGEFIGSLMKKNGAVGGGQAKLTSIKMNPAAIAATCASMAIEYKIGQITQNQKTIIDFMALKEQAQIQGNIKTLLDVMNNYKYNIDNEMYKNNKHILVQSIKNEAEKSLILVDSLVNKMSNQKQSLHFNKDVNLFIKEAVDRLNDYQLGIYQLAFSSLLEIMLLENFDKNYIDSVIKGINCHKEKYALSCNSVKEKIHSLSESSVQNKLMLGASKATSGMGKFIEKTTLGKTQLDEKLLLGGQKLMEAKDKSVSIHDGVLSDVNSNLTLPFEESLENIKMIYNEEYAIAFDNEKVYLDFAA